MQLRHRAALNDAELDELDGRIIIQSIRTDSGKTSMTGISLYGRDGQRLTNVQRDTIDVEIGFGLLIRKTDMAARAELLDAVNTWAATASKENGGAWLTVNYKENRRMHVVLVEPAEEGDLKEWTNTFTVTFRAYGVPYWQEKQGKSVSIRIGTNQTSTLYVGGNVRTVADVELKNESGANINTVTIRAGESMMIFDALAMGASETLVISHDGSGMLSIRVRNAQGQYRSAMDKRTGESSDDLYISPGEQIVGFTSQRGCSMIAVAYGRFL